MRLSTYLLLFICFNSCKNEFDNPDVVNVQGIVENDFVLEIENWGCFSSSLETHRVEYMDDQRMVRSVVKAGDLIYLNSIYPYNTENSKRIIELFHKGLDKTDTLYCSTYRKYRIMNDESIVEFETNSCQLENPFSN